MSLITYWVLLEKLGHMFLLEDNIKSDVQNTSDQFFMVASEIPYYSICVLSFNILLSE